MGHHRDARRGQGRDLIGNSFAALEFHRVRSGFLEEPRRGGQGLCGPTLVTAERKVRHDQCVLGSSDHAAHQGDQFVHGDRDGGVVAVDDVGGRIADQEDGNSGLVEESGGGEVVGGEHGPPMALDLHPLKMVGADLDACGGSAAV